MWKSITTRQDYETENNNFFIILFRRWIGAGCLNPARAVGPAIVMGGTVWNYQWVWWVGDLVGGVVFAVIYRYAIFIRYHY